MNEELKEALNSLEKIKLGIRSLIFYSLNDRERFINNKDFGTVKQALLKAQKNEKGFGCPLDIVVKAVKQATFKGLYFDTVDTDGFKRKGFIKCYLDYDGFTNRFFWATGWNGDIWLSSHKKTWWLKENKEE